MGKKEQLPSPKGEIRRGGVLRQAIHYTLGVAYLVGAEAARKEARADTTVQDEDSVDAGSGDGVER